jgi:hypothetical protein
MLYKLIKTRSEVKYNRFHITKWLALAFLSFSCIRGLAQSFIRPFELELGYNRTTSIIFPYAIKSVDRGSSDILVLKSKGCENVLLVKAGKADFDPTNLTVITAEGKFYSFLVRYSMSPQQLNISFADDSLDIFKLKSFLHIATSSGPLMLTLKSIYIHRQLLWFSFEIKNHSLIDFKPDYIRFFIADKQRVQRTAEQETGLIPKFQVASPLIQARSKSTIAFAFDPFTVAKDKEMILEMGEDHGGRLIRLPMEYNALLRARGTGDQRTE